MTYEAHQLSHYKLSALGYIFNYCGYGGHASCSDLYPVIASGPKEGGSEVYGTYILFMLCIYPGISWKIPNVY